MNDETPSRGVDDEEPARGMTDIPDRIEELRRKRDAEGLDADEARELEGLEDHPDAEANRMPEPRTRLQPPL
jgi:hypothetical protein